MTQPLTIAVLGSGTSTGVPVIGCNCLICTSVDPRDKRLRASIALRRGQEPWLIIDTTPDFRTQVLNLGIQRVAGVLYTHTHADHCHGFDDLRAFSFYSPTPLDCYFLPQYLAEFRQRFSYVFEDTGYQGAKPMVELKPIPVSDFRFAGYEIEPVRLEHGAFETCGFRVGNFAYLTDFKGFPSSYLSKWRGKVDTMIASGIHFGDHHAHNTIPETLALFDALKVKRGIITHLSHLVSHEEVSASLPDGVLLAFDGMIIDV